MLWWSYCKRVGINFDSHSRKLNFKYFHLFALVEAQCSVEFNSQYPQNSAKMGNGKS